MKKTDSNNTITPLARIPSAFPVPDVALFLPTACDDGGTQRVMFCLANGFSRQGLAVDLLVVNTEGAFLKDVSEAVRIVDLRPIQGWFHYKKPYYLYYFQLVLQLATYLRRIRPRSLLSALNIYNFIAIVAHIFVLSSTRLYVSERTTISKVAWPGKAIFQRLLPLTMHCFYRRADKILAVSEGVADDLARFARLRRDSICTIYNPVPVEYIAAKAKQPLAHPWFAPGQPPVLLGVGRLCVAKDFPNLLHAFALIRNKRPVRLVILGEGGLRTELEALAKKLNVADDVIFPGFVANPYAWMHRATVFVLSSAYEGLSNALLEAMASGTSVVSTDCPSGSAEILEDGKWGHLVSIGDPAALAHAIIETLDTPKAVDVTERARDFNVENSVQGYMAAMEL